MKGYETTFKNLLFLYLNNIYFFFLTFTLEKCYLTDGTNPDASEIKLIDKIFIFAYSSIYKHLFNFSYASDNDVFLSLT